LLADKRHQVALLKRIFNGDSLAVPYFMNVRTPKETIMTVIASRSASAIHHNEWISCSHWGMFPARRKARAPRK
jgi:hypothetical protein